MHFRWCRSIAAACVATRTPLLVMFCVTLFGCYVDTPPASQDAVARRLISLLPDHEADVRRTAAEALGKVGAQLAAVPLIDALRDADARVRAAAALSLGRIGAREAVPALVALLDDPIQSVAESSALALGELDPGRNSQAGMVKLLGAGRRSSRVAATRALLSQTTVEYSPILLSALRDGDPSVRQGAVAVLGETGDARVIPHLLKAMERDEDAGVRAESAYRVGKIGDAQAIPHLRRVASSDPSPIVRRWAEWGLQVSMPRPESGSGH